jgi:hypothetical protein
MTCVNATDCVGKIKLSRYSKLKVVLGTGIRVNYVVCHIHEVPCCIFNRTGVLADNVDT